LAIKLAYLKSSHADYCWKI